ncbi:hypothetical protein [Alkalihalobacillus deserti]|uniref:hypothetical protein n=1 Tax=Alkalihalobacillus deserti TaxID=2879466 RepID=UPI001D14D046|nr:hypothetical protein [Alkalihalobacillus deserti]
MQLTLLIINFIFLFGWLLYFTYFLKDKINSMVAMVISMALGMIIGLYVGTLSIIIYPDSYFEVTIISMLIGGVTGVIAGLPSSLAAVLDGLLSGVMGGMMGSMLGTMVSSDHHNQLINVLSVWTVGVFFFVFLLLISEIKKVTKRKKFWLQPFSYFILVCVFLYFMNDYTTIKMNDNNQHYHEYYLNEDEILII